MLLIIRLLVIIRPRAAGAPEAVTVRRMALVLKIVQCVWPLTAQARAENRAVCLSWSNAPHQLDYARRAATVRRMALVLKIVSNIVLSWSNAPCSSGTYGIGMVQCSVPKVLEWDVWHWR